MTRASQLRLATLPSQMPLASTLQIDVIFAYPSRIVEGRLGEGRQQELRLSARSIFRSRVGLEVFEGAPKRRNDMASRFCHPSGVARDENNRCVARGQVSRRPARLDTDRRFIRQSLPICTIRILT